MSVELLFSPITQNFVCFARAVMLWIQNSGSHEYIFRMNKAITDQEEVGGVDSRIMATS